MNVVTDMGAGGGGGPTAGGGGGHGAQKPKNIYAYVDKDDKPSKIDKKYLKRRHDKSIEDGDPDLYETKGNDVVAQLSKMEEDESEKIDQMVISLFLLSNGYQIARRIVVSKLCDGSPFLL